MKMRALIAVLPVVTAVAVGASPAVADSTSSVSANWSGYQVTPAYGSNGFSDVSGSWVQPSANCNTGNAAYSAFWVGLGGGAQAQSLEQVGTQADCSSSGQASYYAWYELVPNAPVQLSMQIVPGDQIAAEVNVSGNSVTIKITDQTTGASFNRVLQMSNPDTSSAEWIAEAPSSCQNGVGSVCTPLPLADFGTAKFSNASATADGYTGTITDPSWSAQPVALDSSLGGQGGYAYDLAGGSTGGSSAGAQPTSLSSDGSSFSVSYLPNGLSQASSAAGSGVSGGGYGGGGYAYGGGGYAPPGAYGGSGGNPYGIDLNSLAALLGL